MRIRDALLNGPLGFGAAPLGNMFRNIPDAEAVATVDAAWNQGRRYFDTAPLYGAGLSEIRLGKELSKHKRNEYILSTKVGRLILDEVEDPSKRDLGEKGEIFKYGRPNKIVYDYTADGVKKSIADSLKRMGVDHVDFVWVHDIAQDLHGDGWLGMFDIARRGAFVALGQLRDQGVIKGWGLGVNKVQPVELLFDLSEVKPDATLLAGRYSLLDHRLALQRVMPEAAAKDIDIVIGGPYSSGVLVGGTHFEYGPVPKEILAKLEKIKGLCAKYSVPIKAAALQFSLAHPAAAAIIPGASKPERIKEDHAALKAKVPGDFWHDLRAQGRLRASLATIGSCCAGCRWTRPGPFQARPFSLERLRHLPAGLGHPQDGFSALPAAAGPARPLASHPWPSWGLPPQRPDGRVLPAGSIPSSHRLAPHKASRRVGYSLGLR
jgi:D-threo-aldose 1-dehydrogenase